MASTEQYTLIEQRVPTPFFDKLARGELSEKFAHLSQEDKDMIIALARVIFEEGLAVGNAAHGVQKMDSIFNF